MDKVFDADRPIARRDQDILGRRPFAEAISDQISAIPEQQGFTVAVVGRWGSGKTSILNMVAETLADEVENTVVLRFNPWLFGGTSDLLTRFFRELGAQIDRNQSENLKAVAKALFSMGKSLAPLSPVPGTALIMDIVDGQISGWAEPRSLFDEHEHLKEALEKSESRMVILIDDIDRLESGETRELMRLVRLTSDLPNVVFLLAFDRQIVETSLSKAGIDGRQYLDKIVQISYDIPAVRRSTLRKVIFADLGELLEGRDLLPVDMNVWPRVFYEIIDPLLDSLRDVKRYLNSLSVTLDTVGHEVAMADLLALEALKILRPSLFEELKARAGFLIHTDRQSQIWLSEEERKNHYQEQIESLLKDTGRERRVLDSVLNILFPATQEFLGGSSYAPSFLGMWRRERRVAYEEVFRIYLMAGLDEDALASRDVEDIVAALTDEKKLTHLIDALDEQQLEEALERILDYEQEIPKSALTIAVPVFANHMGRLSGESIGSFNIPPRFKAYQVIYKLLERFDEPSTLMRCLPEMLEKVETLSGRHNIIEIVGHRENVGGKFVDECDAMRLEQRHVQQLRDTSTEQLISEWNLFPLLSRTQHWIDDEDKDQFAEMRREYLGKDEFVLSLLSSAVGQRFIHNGVSEYSEKIFPLNNLFDIFGTEIGDAVTRLSKSQIYETMSDDDRDTIELAQQRMLEQ